MPKHQEDSKKPLHHKHALTEEAVWYFAELQNIDKFPFTDT